VLHISNFSLPAFPFEELLARRDFALVGAPHLLSGRGHLGWVMLKSTTQQLELALLLDGRMRMR
jgi:hypothetical protein